MRFLVLGGTLFLSKAVAAEAIARGHDVTCAARGSSGAVPDGARLAHLDRAEPDFAPFAGEWDAVVDVARTPSWVRSALAAIDAKHWTFVSSISVYADESIPGGTPTNLKTHEPITDDVEQDSSEKYGASKVGCEQLVQARDGASLVIRPGLIVGPGDPSGRYSYWPQRIAEGGTVLAPGDPERAVQVIDVRDLAAWIVDCAEQGTTGVFDATSPTIPMHEVLAATARGVGAQPELVWLDQDFLVEHEVNPWSGPRSLPLWLPLPAYAGMMAHDVSASLQAGLRIRPLEDTARDTLSWLRDNPDAAVTGLTRAEEAELLQESSMAR